MNTVRLALYDWLPQANRDPQTVLADALTVQVNSWLAESSLATTERHLVTSIVRTLLHTLELGHVCLPLARLLDQQVPDITLGGISSHAELLSFDDIAEFPQTEISVASMRQLLLDSGLVQQATDFVPDSLQVTPLVLDDDNRLYLRRHFNWEQQLAKDLLRIHQAPQSPELQDQQEKSVDLGLARNVIECFFPEVANATRPDWQKIAVALALKQSLLVISGGPGTGKTTTVARLLAVLISLSTQPLRIALAAPTGKAAARMVEALRNSSKNFPEHIQNQLPIAGSTLHRLLGATSQTGRFYHNATNPLAVDILVVDEASMLDLAMASRLLSTIPKGARLILLGDKQQLSAVEAGAVFADISADPGLTPDCRQELAVLTKTPVTFLEPPDANTNLPLTNACVWLTQSYRFSKDSAIGILAASVNQGAGQQTLDWLRANKDEAVHWRETDPKKKTDPFVPLQEMILQGYQAYRDILAQVNAVRMDTVTEANQHKGEILEAERALLHKVFAAFDEFRVLCAVNKGVLGVQPINQWMDRQAAQESPKSMLGWQQASEDAYWYHGRPVLVLQNDPQLGLFNGDVGIALRVSHENQVVGETQQETLQVFFPASNASDTYRHIPLARLPNHTTAFAMTIHKSQGSEFEHVLLVLPNQDNPVLSRELLYTGITRAKRQVSIASRADILLATCSRHIQRYSGLQKRLLEESQSQTKGSIGY